MSTKQVALERLVTRIKGDLGKGLEAYRSAGESLIEAKGMMRKAKLKWRKWLEDNFAMRTRTAQLYMDLARNWELITAHQDYRPEMGYTAALALVRAPKGPRMPRVLPLLSAPLPNVEATISGLASIHLVPADGWDVASVLAVLQKDGAEVGQDTINLDGEVIASFKVVGTSLTYADWKGVLSHAIAA